MAREVELERMVVRLLGDVSDYLAKLDAANRETKRKMGAIERSIAGVERAQKRLNTAADRFSKLGKSIAKAAAPLFGIGALAVREFALFDQAMTESTSIMSVTAEQTKEMRDLALSLSGSVPQSAEELGRSYFFLASAGLDAKQSMEALPVVSRFATAGAFDMSKATDLLTDAQSALGLTVEDSTENMRNMIRVGDVLVKANTLANASVESFSRALGTKAGAALKAVNKDIEEGVAVLAVLADQSVKGELAGNALDRMMRLLKQAALDNQEAFEKYNFSVFDSQEKMRNLADIIENLEDSLEGLTDKQKAAALEALGFKAQVQAVILPLLGTSDAIREYEKELRNAEGITKTVADRQMKSLINQFKIARNQFKLAAIEIGKALAPAVTDLLNQINSILKSTAQWAKENTDTIVTIAKVTATAAALSVGLLALSVTLRTIRFVLGTVRVAMIALRTATLLTTRAFTALRRAAILLARNPVVALLLAVGTSLAITELASKNLTDATTDLDAAYADLGITVDETTKSIKKMDEVQRQMTGAQIRANIAEIDRQIDKLRQTTEKFAGSRKEGGFLVKGGEKRLTRDRGVVVMPEEGRIAISEFEKAQAKLRELVETRRKLQGQLQLIDVLDAAESEKVKNNITDINERIRDALKAAEEAAEEGAEGRKLPSLLSFVEPDPIKETAKRMIDGFLAAVRAEDALKPALEEIQNDLDETDFEASINFSTNLDAVIAGTAEDLDRMDRFLAGLPDRPRAAGTVGDEPFGGGFTNFPASPSPRTPVGGLTSRDAENKLGSINRKLQQLVVISQQQLDSEPFEITEANF